MKRRSWLYLGLAAVAFAALLAWAFRPRAVPVEAAAARVAPFEQTVDEDGRTRVRERYVVSAPLAGRLARIELKAGDEVEAGKPIAFLSPSAPALLDARTERELRERVGMAEATLAQAKAEVARAAAALEQATIDLARQKRLENEGFVSPAARDQAELNVRVHRQALAAARSGEEAARHGLAQAQAALSRAHETGSPSAALPIVAPVTGRVLRVMQESESVVAIGTPIMEIADTNDLEIVVDVLSTEATRIAPGAAVHIDAGNGPAFSGRVRRVEPSAFTKVSALGIEEQRVNVIVDFALPPDSPVRLGDNFRVDVRIVTFARDAALVVPVGALFRAGEDWAVFAIEDGRAVQRTVRVGARNAVDAWVEQGLAEGDRVIVYPADSVRDGVRVQVVRS